MHGGSGTNIVKVHTTGTVGAIDAKESGAWHYMAGENGGVKAVPGRMVGSFFYAHGAAGTVEIDGGETIYIRAGVGININPKGNLQNPTIEMSASIDYMIEYVT
jgi:hypothetical protein